MSATTTRPASACARGFTLVEASIVLAVTAILLAMALPMWGSLSARQRVLAAGEALVQGLTLARQETVRRGQPLYLVAHAGADWCWAISTQPTCDCRQAATGCAWRQASASDSPGVTLTQAQGMRLDPQDGRASGGLAATWRAAPARPDTGAAEVHVHPFGRTRLCARGAPLPGVPAC